MNNMFKIKDSGLLDYLIKLFYPQSIVLYGSYLKGEDIETSDIDLFILTKAEKNVDLEKFEKLLKRKIHLLILSDMKKLTRELKSEVINGFILHGYLKI